MFPFGLMFPGVYHEAFVLQYIKTSHIYVLLLIFVQKHQEVWLKNIRPQCSYLGIDVLHL